MVAQAPPSFFTVMTENKTHSQLLFLNRRKRQRLFHQRNWHGFFSPNKECLPGFAKKPAEYEFVIHKLCSYYNSFHATKTKNCSVLTSQKRRQFYLQFFGKVSTKFKIDPRSLKPKHVEWYFSEKINQAKDSGTAHSSIVRSIANEVSMLEFFSLWIGKKGLIKSSNDYLKKLAPDLINAKPPKVRNTFVSGEQLAEILEKAFKTDLLFGMQLLCMALFGLRNKEALSLNPEESISTEKVAGTGNDNFGKLEIFPNSGSKGGRPRTILFYTHEEAFCAERIKRFAKQAKLRYLRHPNHGLEKALFCFHQTAKRLGLGSNDFQGSAYSLRHSYAQALHAFLSKNAIGTPTGKESEENHLAVSIALGHYRKSITGVYCGSFQPVGKDIGKDLIRRLLHPSTSLSTAKAVIICWLREFFQQDPKGAIFATMWFMDKDLPINNPDFMGMLSLFENEKKSRAESDYIIERCVKCFGFEEESFAGLLRRYANCLPQDEIEQQLWTPYFSKLALAC